MTEVTTGMMGFGLRFPEDSGLHRSPYAFSFANPDEVPVLEYGEMFTPYSMIPRIIAVALFTIGVVVAGLFLSGHLLSFPQDFLKLFHHVDYVKLITVSIGLVSLMYGASVVIRRARNNQQDLLAPLEITYEEKGEVKTSTDMLEVVENPEARVRSKKKTGEGPKLGDLANAGKHLEVVKVLNDENKPVSTSDYVYLDLSTLDENGSGKAFLYHIKDIGDHYSIHTIIALFSTPVYVIGVIAYNALRAIALPLYILGQCLYEKVTDKQSFPEGKFELIDVGIEFYTSIERIITAPLYALAYFMAAFYAFINPIGGRKLITAIEQDWNGKEQSIAEAFWLTVKPQIHWAPEGGGGPIAAKRNGFGITIAGCDQPLGIVEMDQWDIRGAYWVAALSDRGYLDLPNLGYCSYHIMAQPLEERKKRLGI